MGHRVQSLPGARPRLAAPGPPRPEGPGVPQANSAAVSGHRAGQRVRPQVAEAATQPRGVWPAFLRHTQSGSRGPGHQRRNDAREPPWGRPVSPLRPDRSGLIAGWPWEASAWWVTSGPPPSPAHLRRRFLSGRPGPAPSSALRPQALSYRKLPLLFKTRTVSTQLPFPRPSPRPPEGAARSGRPEVPRPGATLPCGLAAPPTTALLQPQPHPPAKQGPRHWSWTLSLP